MDSNRRQEFLDAAYKWLAEGEREASRLIKSMRQILEVVTEMEAGGRGEATATATAPVKPRRTNPAVQPETRRPGFRRLVEQTLRRNANVEVTVGDVAAAMAETYGGHVSFTPPYKTNLRGRVAVELGAMRRSDSYPVRRGRDRGTYVYDLTVQTPRLAGSFRS